MVSAVELDLFAPLDLVPSRDENFVFRIGGCMFAGQLVNVIQVLESICQMRGSGVPAVRQ